MTIVLSADQIAFWNDNGYLVLRQAIPPETVASVLRTVDAQWAGRAGNDHEVDILSGPDDGRTFRRDQSGAYLAHTLRGENAPA